MDLPLARDDVIRRPSRPLVPALVFALITAASASAQTYSFTSAIDSGGAKPAGADSAPETEFKPTWKFDAWLFGTFTFQTDSAAKAANGGNPASQFTLDRAYLTFLGQVAPAFGFRVTTDVKYLPAGNPIYNGLIIRLKYAYLQWDYLRAATPAGMSAWARIGSIHTVVIEDEERFWPRWLQKTALEYWAIQTGAADLGASTQLTLPNKWGWAYLTVGNGSGYQVANDPDRYKDVALRLSLTPLSKSAGFLRTFQVTGWGQLGTTQAPAPASTPLANNAGGVFVGIADPRFTFGAEFAEREVQTLTSSVKSTIVASVIDRVRDGAAGALRRPEGDPVGSDRAIRSVEGEHGECRESHPPAGGRLPGCREEYVDRHQLPG